tara:strand:- start:8464 stop:8769 length:306 start_codon:yes stop_codon:yes gene_type:complete
LIELLHDDPDLYHVIRIPGCCSARAILTDGRLNAASETACSRELRRRPCRKLVYNSLNADDMPRHATALHKHTVAPLRELQAHLKSSTQAHQLPSSLRSMV